jgi:hypothetical protein
VENQKQFIWRERDQIHLSTLAIFFYKSDPNHCSIEITHGIYDTDGKLLGNLAMNTPRPFPVITL